MTTTGAILLLLGAMLTLSAPGQGRQPHAGAVLTVAGDAPLSWAFTTERPGLDGVQFWLASPAPPGSALLVTIATSAAPEAPLVATGIPLDATGAEGELELGFDPLLVRESPHVPTTTLAISLTPQGLPPGVEVELLGSADKGEEGVGPVPAFTPSYQVRPFDRIWPISRMAEGRPGLLGWPPLYPVLVYGFLVLLLRTLWLAARELFVVPAPARD